MRNWGVVHTVGAEAGTNGSVACKFENNDILQKIALSSL